MIKKEDKQRKAQHQNDKCCSCLCHIHSPSQCYCACPYPKIDSGHQPFLIRTCIVGSGVLVGFLGYAWGWFDGEILFWKLGLEAFLQYCLTVALACYFCWVTLWDGLAHYVLKLKPSSFADEKKLSEQERVTGEELDHYFDTRRNIRFVSLIAAICAYGASAESLLSVPLIAFCIAYIVSTSLGILGVRLFSKRRRPRLIHRDRRYDIPHWHRPSMNSSEYMLNYGRWQRGETGAPPIWY